MRWTPSGGEMEFLRKIVRIPLFILWFIGSSTVCRIVNHGKRASEKSLEWTLLWAKVTARIFNLEVRVLGSTEGFSGGLIAANHQSCLDILVLAAAFKIRFAPKAEMRRWPLVGFMTQCNDPVWIDRSTPRKAKASAEAMSRTMSSGMAMMVFPEGTVSDGKNGLLPFKSTSFQAVLDSGRKVLPVLISYDEDCRSRVQWAPDAGFPAHVWSLLGLKKTSVTLYILDPVPPVDGEDRKMLTERIYNIMNEKWRSL